MTPSSKQNPLITFLKKNYVLKFAYEINIDKNIPFLDIFIDYLSHLCTKSLPTCVVNCIRIRIN